MKQFSRWALRALRALSVIDSLFIQGLFHSRSTSLVVYYPYSAKKKTKFHIGILAPISASHAYAHMARIIYRNGTAGRREGVTHRA